MRTKILALVAIALTFLQAGCATGFRATGPRGGGIDIGVEVAQPVVVVEKPPAMPPHAPPLSAPSPAMP